MAVHCVRKSAARAPQPAQEKPCPHAAKLAPPPLIDQDELLRRNRGLRLLDDIFMQACFQSEPRCVERILRVILGVDLRARRVALQKTLKNLHGRSIVMDVLAVDERGKLYNIEIQTGLPGANPRRPRYHLSMMDVNVKRPGKHFERLPEVFSIFIVAGDPFGAGRPLYVFTRRTEDGAISLGDGTTIIYANALLEDADTDLGKLMHDFRCPNPGDMYYPELAKAARYFKENPKGVRIMGSMMESLLKEGRRYGRQEGRQEGRLEGQLEGRREGRDEAQRSAVGRMLAAGKLGLEEIALYAGLSLDEVRAIAESEAR